MPIAQSQANEGGGWVSPDGRWVAYRSDESGRDQIYAQAFAIYALSEYARLTGSAVRS